MRVSVVALLVGLSALAFARPERKITDRQFLERQRDVLRLFKFVNQPSHYKEHVKIAQDYRIHDHFNCYTRPEVAQQYYQIYRYGLLPRGQVFSVFNEEHLEQAIALYRVFYYAKDYQTFYNTAVWARQNVNEGVYLYALSVAIVHRPDTYGIILPPIYEVYPYYFYNNEVIERAQRHKQQCCEEDHQVFTITANYSAYYMNLHPELSYFTEDVGVNSFYYYYNIYYPYWLGGEDFDYQMERRGELDYYMHLQLLARYYLERLSNGLGEIPIYNYEVPFETGYHPSLQYPNGLQFPTRPNHVQIPDNHRYPYRYTLVQDCSRRIRDVIDKGFVYTRDGKRINMRTPEGINVLGNLVQSNPDSPDNQYYGALQVYVRQLLGDSYQSLNQLDVAPSALEHFETSLRDPVFYQFYKRLMWYFQKHKSQLPSYTEQDLRFEGVEVRKVEFDRLVTYFDYFYSDLSNAVYVTPQEFEHDKVQIRAKQQRLNHKPFTYRIHVNSEKEQDASVRVYIGPKFDEYGRYINISRNRLNFVQFDHFKYRLQSGENVIERNSHQNYFYQDDRTSYKELYQRVLGAVENRAEFTVDQFEPYFGFPRRLLLPKGDYGGVEYQFYVVVSPYVPYKRQEGHDYSKDYYPRVGTGAQYIDNYPLGYPFDRRIHYDQIYQNVPNFYSYSAKIYHRQFEDINASTAQH